METLVFLMLSFLFGWHVNTVCLDSLEIVVTFGTSADVVETII